MMAQGVYDIPKVESIAVAVVTNTAPMTAYRGAGRPEASAAIERAFDLFAVEIGMDPAELRRRNLIEAFPFTTTTGLEYDSGDYHRTLDLALETVDYDELRAEQRRRREVGKPVHLGIGIAVTSRSRLAPSPATRSPRSRLRPTGRGSLPGPPPTARAT